MIRYVLNIGNTRCAVTEGEVTADSRIWYCDSRQVAESWTPSGEWSAVASCVVPAVRDALREKWGDRIHFISGDDYPWVDFTAYQEGRLGSDRMANVAAASRLLPGCRVIVADCGTALNTVTVDENGRFCGGVIFPGRETALSALSRNTAQLPEFSVNADHEMNPLGVNTVQGMKNGIDIGMVGAAGAIIRATLELPGWEKARVWFTGGDAAFFVQYLEPQFNAQVAPLPLTLYGISLAAPK
jgi:pantothenate kinase type III